MIVSQLDQIVAKQWFSLQSEGLLKAPLHECQRSGFGIGLAGDIPQRHPQRSGVNKGLQGHAILVAFTGEAHPQAVVLVHQQRSRLVKKLRINRPRQIHIAADIAENIRVQHLVKPDLPMGGGKGCRPAGITGKSLDMGRDEQCGNQNSIRL